MTAAVARPPLFTHLVASRPAREKGSVTATMTSVVVHAALIVGAVLLSARVRQPAPVVQDPPILVTTPTLAPPSPTPARTATRGGGGPAAPRAIPIPMPPDAISAVIPKAGTVELGEFPDFAKTNPAARSGVGDPTAREAGGSGFGEFVPITVKPELLNRSEIARLLQRYYPTSLLQAGIGGEVVVWLQVDVTGAVVDTRVSKSSRRKELDEAALRVAEAMRFSPAYNRDQKVKVWVELPIIFGAR